MRDEWFSGKTLRVHRRKKEEFEPRTDRLTAAAAATTEEEEVENIVTLYGYTSTRGAGARTNGYAFLKDIGLELPAQYYCTTYNARYIISESSRRVCYCMYAAGHQLKNHYDYWTIITCPCCRKHVLSFARPSAAGRSGTIFRKTRGTANHGRKKKCQFCST